MYHNDGCNSITSNKGDITLKQFFRTKIVALLILISTGLVLTGCGNMQIIDTTYTYNYAQFELPDGTFIEGELLRWSDYDGEQLQLKMEDGNVYLVSSYNAVLSTSKIEKDFKTDQEKDEKAEDIQAQLETGVGQDE